MKSVFTIAFAVAMFNFATLPAEAIQGCTVSYSQGTVAVLPPVCALPETKVNHPKWYRDGGYCDGGAYATASGPSHLTCPKGP